MQTKSNIQPAVSALIFKDYSKNQFLIGQRNSGIFQTLYSLPGGRVNFGETLETALIREISEETNLKIAKPTLLTHLDIFSTKENYHYVLLVFEIFDFSGNFKDSSEMINLHWCSIDKLSSLQTTPNLKNIIDYAQTR